MSKTPSDDKMETTSLKAEQPPDARHGLGTGSGLFLGQWKQGKEFSYKIPKSLKKSVALKLSDYRSLFLILIIAFYVRFRDLANPPEVVAEEAIIGRYINNYIGGKFFVDSQTPFPYIVNLIVSKIFNYWGNFDFDVQTSYIGHAVPFHALRAFNASLGVLTVVLTYLTLKSSGVARLPAVLGSVLVLFENSLVTEYRYVFPLPTYYTIIVSMVYVLKRQQLCSPLSFSWHWYGMGISVLFGLLAGSRMNTYPTFAWITIYAAYELWWSLADLSFGFWRTLYLIIYRIFQLIVVPTTVLMTVMSVHIILTPITGPGDHLMSGGFQSTLLNTPGSAVAAEVSYGSLVTLKNTFTSSYLHSHEAYLQTGSFQQQVTLYSFRDLNNVWIFENITDPAPGESIHSGPHIPIKDGEIIRVRHLQSTRRLHSHVVKAPISEADFQFEVSAYGADGYPGDMNDLWQVEIDQLASAPGLPQKEVRALQTKFHLRHLLTNCYLFGHEVKLPSWAFEQNEVTCAVRGKPNRSLWYVETNYHPKHTEEDDYIDYIQPSIVAKIGEVLNVMKDKLKQTADHQHWTIPAWKLPLMVKGATIYRQHYRQIYIMGNLVVWYLSIASMVSFLLYKVGLFLFIQRGYRISPQAQTLRQFDHSMGIFVVGWFVHYIPLFFTKPLITDYLPALYFSILGFAQVWDLLLKTLFKNRIVSTLLTGLIITSTVAVFVIYSPLTYGSLWLRSTCERYDLSPGWQLICPAYLETREQYAEYDAQNKVRYEYIAPPPEELEPPSSVVASKSLADAAQATAFEARKDKPIDLDLERPEIQQALFRNMEMNLKQKSGGIIQEALFMSIREGKYGEFEVGSEISEFEQDQSVLEEFDIEASVVSIDTELQSTLWRQWARITDPPKIEGLDQKLAELSANATASALSANEPGNEPADESTGANSAVPAEDPVQTD